MTQYGNARIDSRVPARVALLGLGERTDALLRMMVERSLAAEIAIVAEDAADLLIVDGDSLAGQAILMAEGHGVRAKPAVVLVQRPGPASPGRRYVRKPIDVDELLAALRHLRHDPPAATDPGRAAPGRPWLAASAPAAGVLPPAESRSGAGEAAVPCAASGRASAAAAKAGWIEICMTNELPDFVLQKPAQERVKSSAARPGPAVGSRTSPESAA